MIFVKNADKKMFDFRTKSMDYPLQKNVHFLALVKTSIFCSYNVCFLSKITKNHFFWHNFCTKHPYEKFRFLDKIHGLTPLETVNFLALFWNFNFFHLKSFFSFINIKKKIFCDIISVKNTDNRNHDFWTKSWTNPFEKCLFFDPI